jgi:RHS repeat-associated protein
VTIPSVPADHWKAEYFGNPTLSGTPVATVDEGTGFVDHSWGTGGPANLADKFSARVTRTVTLVAGTYRFTTTTDDGSALWVDDQLQINAWGADGLTTHTVDLDLAAGDHALRFQSVEHTGGATAQLTWALRTPVVLASGESLGENQTRVSLDGAYRLQYQGDGNLVVVRLADDSCAWSSQTNNTSAGATVMQGDGNLVVYNGDWTAVWTSGTNGHDGARLQIANDTMAIVGPDETTLWSVSLAAAPEPRSSARAVAEVVPPPGSHTPLGAPAVLAFVAALLALATAFVRRPSSALARRATVREPDAGRRVRARVPATALLLTALLLVPASALAQTSTQVVEYYHTDALGSVRAVTKQVNGEWAVAARHDFMPFGEEVSPQIPPQDKRLFTGKERDAETAMDYFGARYYQADLGRFSTVDPELNVKGALVDPRRWNRFSYVANNPLKYTDPDGRDIRYATPALREQLFRLARYAPGLAAEIVAAVKDPTILVNIVEKDFENTCRDNAPGCDTVGAEDGVKIVKMTINPNDDGTAQHEWGHEKDVRTNWAQFWKDTHDPKELAKEHESADEGRAEAHKKAWEQQHKLIANPKEWQKLIKAVSSLPLFPGFVQ